MCRRTRQAAPRKSAPSGTSSPGTSSAAELCRQLQELKLTARRFEKVEAQILGISSDSPEKLAAFAQVKLSAPGTCPLGHSNSCSALAHQKPALVLKLRRSSCCAQNQHAPYPLLSDKGGVMRKALGIKGNFLGVVPGREV